MSEDLPTISFVDQLQYECYEGNESHSKAVSDIVSEIVTVNKEDSQGKESESADETKTLNTDNSQDAYPGDGQSPESISVNESETDRELPFSNTIEPKLNTWNQWKKDQVSNLSGIIQEAKSLESEDDVSGFMQYYLDGSSRSDDNKIRSYLENAITSNLKTTRGVNHDILSVILEAISAMRDNCVDYKKLSSKFLSLVEILNDNPLLEEEINCLGSLIEDEKEFLRKARSVIEIIESRSITKRQSFIPAIEEIRESIQKLNTRITIVSQDYTLSECVSVASEARRFVFILDGILSQHQMLNIAETTTLKVLIIERSVILDGVDKIITGKYPKDHIKKYCLNILSAVDRSCVAVQKIVSTQESFGVRGIQNQNNKKRALSLTCITAVNSNPVAVASNISSAIDPGTRNDSMSIDTNNILIDMKVDSSTQKGVAGYKEVDRYIMRNQKFNEIRCNIQNGVKMASINQSPPDSGSIEPIRPKYSPSFVDVFKTPKGRRSLPSDSSKSLASPDSKKKTDITRLDNRKQYWINELIKVQSTRLENGGTIVKVEDFIKNNYDENSINFSEGGKIVAATLEALIEQLTLHDKILDRFFASAFLLLFRRFTTPCKFLSLIIERFSISPPSGLTEYQLIIWKEKMQIPIRLRTYNVLRMWVEVFWDPDTDDHCLPELRMFAVEKMADLCNNLSKRLVELVDKRIYGTTPTIINTTTMIPLLESPIPILPKHKVFCLHDLDTLEVARQLTLIVNRLFMLIKPKELVDQSWSKKNDNWKNNPSNVKAVISMSNKITFWAVCTILREKNIKERASCLKFFIKLCTKLAKIHNYDTLMAIKSAIDMSCIARLKRTWEILSNKTKAAYEQVASLLDFGRNFSNYRNMIKNMIPPCTPFLGLYLTDLTFIENGLPTYREYRGKELINFSKFVKVYKIIHNLQLFQAPYPFQEIFQIQCFILNDIQNAEIPPSSKLYELSLELEPKEVANEDPRASVDAKVKAFQKAGLLKL